MEWSNIAFETFLGHSTSGYKRLNCKFKTVFSIGTLQRTVIPPVSNIYDTAVAMAIILKIRFQRTFLVISSPFSRMKNKKKTSFTQVSGYSKVSFLIKNSKDNLLERLSVYA